MEANVQAKLYEALAKAQGEFPEIVKSKENPFFKSKYADLAEVISTVKSTLTKNGLAISQTLNGSNLETHLFHKDGGSIFASVPINTAQKIQSLGSEITYMRRYSLCAILGVTADDDNDGNETPEEAPQQKSQPQKQATHAPKPEIKNQTLYITEKQVSRLWAIAKTVGLNYEETNRLIKETTGKNSAKELNKREYDLVCSKIESTEAEPWPEAE